MAVPEAIAARAAVAINTSAPLIPVSQSVNAAVVTIAVLVQARRRMGSERAAGRSSSPIRESIRVLARRRAMRRSRMSTEYAGTLRAALGPEATQADENGSSAR
jgi:hypothetical protein